MSNHHNVTSVVRMIFGSQIYGTATPESDTDYKGIHIPCGRDIVLGRPPQAITNNTKDNSVAKNTKEDVDSESYSVWKFLNLAAEGQTVAMDMLFAPTSAILETSEVWEEIIANREKLVTSQSKSFVGYCRTQANKYGLKGSRMDTAEGIINVLKPHAQRQPNLKLGTLDVYLQGFTSNHLHCGVIDIEQNLQGEMKKIRHLEVCDRKAPYTITLKEALAIYQRLYDNYGERARKAKDNEGIDWKALSHAVRVGGECIELLKTGYIVFPRPEAAHLLDVKLGKLPYYEVAEEIEGLLVAAEEASERSTLRTNPDRKWIEDFTWATYTDRIFDDIYQEIVR